METVVVAWLVAGLVTWAYSAVVLPRQLRAEPRQGGDLLILLPIWLIAGPLPLLFALAVALINRVTQRVEATE